MPYFIQVSCPSDLTINTGIININIVINLTPYASRNGLTLYHGYSSGTLPIPTEIRFLPIFGNCQLIAYFSINNGICYHHRYEQLDANHLIPEDDNFIFYSCKNLVRSVNNMVYSDFIYKHNSIDCFTTVVKC